MNHKNPDINKADLCASFQKTVTETLIENIKKAIKYLNNEKSDDLKKGEIKLVLAGRGFCKFIYKKRI